MKKLWKLLVTLCLVTALAMAIFPASVLAIQNGIPDENNHPYVCLVAFYDAGGTFLWRTTGTLISPTVVLTVGTVPTVLTRHPFGSMRKWTPTTQV